ncbi:MAG: hypothetical protein IKW80_09885, partial [Thermoguttaceae bacterium]|nr:hypothetical protein [Thermoguttaceae bacterium]
SVLTCRKMIYKKWLTSSVFWVRMKSDDSGGERRLARIRRQKKPSYIIFAFLDIDKIVQRSML